MRRMNTKSGECMRMYETGLDVLTCRSRMIWSQAVKDLPPAPAPVAPPSRSEAVAVETVETVETVEVTGPLATWRQPGPSPSADA